MFVSASSTELYSRPFRLPRAHFRLPVEVTPCASRGPRARASEMFGGGHMWIGLTSSTKCLQRGQPIANFCPVRQRIRGCRHTRWAAATDSARRVSVFSRRAGFAWYHRTAMLNEVKLHTLRHLGTFEYEVTVEYKGHAATKYCRYIYSILKTAAAGTGNQRSPPHDHFRAFGTCRKLSSATLHPPRLLEAPTPQGTRGELRPRTSDTSGTCVGERCFMSLSGVHAFPT